MSLFTTEKNSLGFEASSSDLSSCPTFFFLCYLEKHFSGQSDDAADGVDVDDARAVVVRPGQGGREVEEHEEPAEDDLEAVLEDVDVVDDGAALHGDANLVALAPTRHDVSRHLRVGDVIGSTAKERLLDNDLVEPLDLLANLGQAEGELFNDHQ